MVSIVGKAETYIKRITCRNCSSILEYTKSELLKSTGRDYSGGSSGCEWLLCPSCHKDVIVNSW